MPERAPHEDPETQHPLHSCSRPRVPSFSPPRAPGLRRRILLLLWFLYEFSILAFSVSKTAHEAPQEAPKKAPVLPRDAQDEPESAQRRAQEASKTPHQVTKTPQHVP